MRIFPDGYGSGPGPARDEILWNCLRGLGDTVLRLHAGPRALSAALAQLPLINVHGANRLARSCAACCPSANGPDEQGAWLYGRSMAIHYRRGSALLLASRMPPVPTLLFFDAGGSLTQALAPAGEGSERCLDALINDHLHPRQDCLPELVSRPETPRPPLAGELSELERRWRQSDSEAAFTRELQARGLDRACVYRQIGDQYAAPVAPETLASVLALAQARGLAVQLTQLLAQTSQQFNAVPHARSWHGDRLSFCLGPSRHEWHCRYLGALWRVRRPGLQGIETSLEVLDDRGQLALVLAGNRERPWRRLLADTVYPPAGG